MRMAKDTILWRNLISLYKHLVVQSMFLVMKLEMPMWEIRSTRFPIEEDGKTT